jgi:hypothetical protein
MIYLVKMFIICSEFSAESMQGYEKFEIKKMTNLLRNDII